MAVGDDETASRRTQTDLLNNRTSSIAAHPQKSFYAWKRFHIMVQDMEKTTTDFGEILIQLIDKLAGKKSDIKLSFQDLTLDTGMVKVKLNGSIVLDVLYVAEQ